MSIIVYMNYHGLRQFFMVDCIINGSVNDNVLNRAVKIYVVSSALVYREVSLSFRLDSNKKKMLSITSNEIMCVLCGRTSFNLKL